MFPPINPIFIDSTTHENQEIDPSLKIFQGKVKDKILSQASENQYKRMAGPTVQKAVDLAKMEGTRLTRERAKRAEASMTSGAKRASFIVDVAFKSAENMISNQQSVDEAVVNGFKDAAPEAAAVWAGQKAVTKMFEPSIRMAQQEAATLGTRLARGSAESLARKAVLSSTGVGLLIEAGFMYVESARDLDPGELTDAERSQQAREWAMSQGLGPLHGKAARAKLIKSYPSAMTPSEMASQSFEEIISSQKTPKKPKEAPKITKEQNWAMKQGKGPLKASVARAAYVVAHPSEMTAKERTGQSFETIIKAQTAPKQPAPKKAPPKPTKEQNWAMKSGKGPLKPSAAKAAYSATHNSKSAYTKVPGLGLPF